MAALLRALRPAGLAGPSTGRAAQVLIHGKPVGIEWSRAAQAALERRARPLGVELELTFSCLVKKFVHFRDDATGLEPVAVNDRLHLAFRVVTSQACSMDLAQRLGRQPEIALDNPVVRRLAPKRFRLDHRHGRWAGEFWV
jgi:hypothetical protein